MQSLQKQQFFGHWRWVHIRTCANGHTARILGGDTRRPAQLPQGAILCHCGKQVNF